MTPAEELAKADAMVAGARRLRREARAAIKAAKIEAKEAAFRASGKRRWPEIVAKHDARIAAGIIARLKHGTWAAAAREMGFNGLRCRVIMALHNEKRAKRIEALLTADQWSQITAVIPPPWRPWTARLCVKDDWGRGKPHARVSRTSEPQD